MNRHHRSQRGVALVSVLFFALLAIAYGTSALSGALGVRGQARYHTAAQRAHEAAESGVHAAIARLHSDNADAFLAAGEARRNLQGDGARAVRYKVTIARADSDGADNDQDGRIDEPDERDMYELTSTGVADNVARTVKVTLLARYRDADMNSAAYIADPTADLGFSGNSFVISGFNHRLDGTIVPGTVAGIGTPGSPDYLRNQLRRQQEDNVIGEGGSPSVLEVPPLDLQDLIEEGARAATVTLQEGTNHPEDEGAWGTIDAPKILYGSGEVKIAGGGAGAGILIVDGDLTIAGGFEWSGLIITRGEILFVGGGGGKRLTGGLIVEENVLDEDPESGLDVRGTVDILFSTQAISRVMQSFATYTILNWRESANPEDAFDA